ncbi:transcription antitermination factor NusB [Roseomonas xinghualingensis]|uniref:transcription antitermination factor NusB n=1 Tax=Roseomonas xinghualingensis TaxID=2986475 RepID=UPI0021F1FFF8|nr:transcription antitermination factor NusB [Roseomonas sp. SXEYE001]MCV4206869.1 transcription antitermination factor NusB [Roseomonas sp. SXEYE001]
MNQVPKRNPRPNAGRPRTGARVAAVQALFQSEAGGESAEAVIDQFVRHRIGTLNSDGGFEDGRVPQADVPLFSKIVRGAAKNSETIDAAIAGHLSASWSLERLDPVLRALLRAAAAELWSGADTPARVVINEYMDIAHGFFDGEEPRFANGVLDALARQMRGGEFQPRG